MSNRAKNYMLAFEVSMCLWAAIGLTVWAVT